MTKRRTSLLLVGLTALLAAACSDDEPTSSSSNNGGSNAGGSDGGAGLIGGFGGEGGDGGDGGDGGVASVCGDGVIDLDEDCDDGNTLAHDGCDDLCLDEILDWTAINPGAGPAVRYGAKIVDTNPALVMFGGYSGAAQGDIIYNDTWVFGGAAWSQVPVASPPEERVFVAMAYHAADDVTVMFGGNGVAWYGDTWEFNGASWSKNAPATSPSMRSGAAMVYDSLRERIVLFGGWITTTHYNDTWEYDGDTWTQITTTTTPPARAQHAMAYDEARDRIVMFGGCSACSGSIQKFDDTWEFDGSDWEQNVVPAPTERYLPSMAYDPNRELVIMFGGLSDTQSYLNDVLEYDGTGWTVQTTIATPSARHGGALTYMQSQGMSVLFGGATAGGIVNDTWLYGYD